MGEREAAAEAQACIEALEGIVAKGTVSLTLVEVLDLSADAQSTIDTDKRLDTCHRVEVKVYFHQQRHLKIVQFVSERAVVIALATLLGIVQTGL